MGLPEVIRLEVQEHLRSDLMKARDSVRDGHRRLLAVFGRLKEVVLPSDADIDNIVDTFFDRFALNCLDVPFTFESAKLAFMRTIKKLPPCEKSEQFKDAVIWEDCRELAKMDDVVLLTDDRAFFEKEDLKSGLSEICLFVTRQPKVTRLHVIIFPDTNLLIHFRDPGNWNGVISYRAETIELAIGRTVQKELQKKAIRTSRPVPRSAPAYAKRLGDIAKLESRRFCVRVARAPRTRLGR